MKKYIFIVLTAVFVTILGTSTYFIFDYYHQAGEQEELYDSLVETVKQAQTAEPTTPAESVPYNEEKTFLPEYAELYAQNSDMAGWIQVPDTSINYPGGYCYYRDLFDWTLARLCIRHFLFGR